PRPGPARSARRRGRPDPGQPLLRRADPDAHRVRRPGGPGRGPHPRRRRLHGQAVRLRRTGRPGAGAVPAGGPAAAAGAQPQRHHPGPGQPRRRAGRPRGPAHPQGVRGPGGPDARQRHRGQRRRAAGEGLGRERRPVHQRRPGDRDDAAQEARRAAGHPDRPRRGVPAVSASAGKGADRPRVEPVAPAGPGEVPPTPPGETGTWRRLSAPQQAPAPASGSKLGGSVADGLHRFTDNMSLRARLTLIYGMLFFAAGSLLVLLNYVIVAGVLDNLPFRSSTGQEMDPSEVDFIKSLFIEELLAQLTRFSVLALAVVGLLAVGLGYAVAGRALSPLQKITRTARRLSERSLHERIALGGPDD